jgi:hypothetical protein
VTFHWRTMCGLVLAAGALAGAARAADPDLGAAPKEVQAVVEKALTYFKKSQQDDGGFSTKRVGPGISALVAAALLRNGVSPDDPTVAKTLTYLEHNVKDNGGIYDKALANYTTCVAIMAFSEANANGRYDTILKNATQFIKKLQYDDSKVDAKDPRFGGLGYDDKSRPDLSNTQYFLDALQAAGVGKDDPAVQRALKFVSRCQNLPGETNDQAFARKATADDKGGLSYVNNPDEAEDRIKTAAGGLRSQGAMTYAGLKSFLYAGVSKDDPRV